MIFTVAVIIVDGESFVDPRLDTLTPVIREAFEWGSNNQFSFEILTVSFAPHGEEGIRSLVRENLERNPVDLTVVVGGIGFEDEDCTPEVTCPLKLKLESITLYLRIISSLRQLTRS